MDQKKLRHLSNYKLRQAEAWKAFFDVANFRKKSDGGRWFPVHTTSVYGSQTPADAVLIVGDNFRAAAEAAQYLQVQYLNFGEYPEVVCVKGFSTPKAVSYGKPAQYWLKKILSELGIPDEVVNGHNMPDDAEPIDAVVEFFGRHRSLDKIVVFSSRGYSLSVAQQIFMKMPNKNWVFYENKYIDVPNRIFEAEIVGPEGFAVDALISQTAKALQGIGTKRYPLTADVQVNLPKQDVLVKFVEKGYALGFESFRDMDYFSLDLHKGVELHEGRKDDFRWMQIPERACEHVEEQVKRLVQQYADFEP